MASAAEKATPTRIGRIRRWVMRAVLVALVATPFGIVGTAVLSGQWTVHPVLSGSMRPGFPVGSVVVTQREPIRDLAVRDVIITNPPGDPHFDLIHRVIAVSQSAAGPVVQTMGDANPVPDPWRVTLHGRTIYIARFTLPLIGYFAVWAHSSDGRHATLALAGLLLLAAVINATRKRRAARPVPGLVEAPGGTSDLTPEAT
jgi:signal peptidase